MEHIEVMSEAEAVVKEKQWHAMFKDMRKRCEWFHTIANGVDTQLMFHWFPYENEIETFIERRKARDSTTEFDEESVEHDHQEQLLF
ncbi:hypothetical protein RBSWK_03385 [Rhodopirellula baltica SWK14]|uniref:Uncharacterized protein n=1 Tax=Rhodopirellula baltica SWK14 TaxID=993516 RepID=L7CGF6_RHOBT|nr:hypothetical protein RBSWK_03385 [Rhodopirellula baltica SWK14]